MLVIYFHINIHVNDWFDIIWQIKNDRYTFDKNRKMKTGHLHIQHVNIKKKFLHETLHQRFKFYNNKCLYLIQKTTKRQQQTLFYIRYNFIRSFIM